MHSYEHGQRISKPSNLCLCQGYSWQENNQPNRPTFLVLISQFSQDSILQGFDFVISISKII